MSLPPIGGDAPLVFVAGPCVIEPGDGVFRIAEALTRLRVPVIFKASFDKANRSDGSAFRGPGLEAGLEVLAQVRRRFDLPLLTDVHAPEQCAPAAEVVDVLQIPAFLCRQTDLVRAAAATGRPVNLKRGQFLDPRRMGRLVEKAGGRAWVTERGTTFGHGDLVFDPRALVWMGAIGVPVLFDCTHSVQASAGEAAHTGGDREMVLPLARAAAAVGVAGFYAEVHLDPPRALSDAATQLDPAAFARLVAAVSAIDAARRASA